MTGTSCNRIAALLSLLAALFAAGCAVRAVGGEPAAVPPPEEAAEPAGVAVDLDPGVDVVARPVGEYRLGAGDVVRIVVIGNPEATGEYVIGPDGLVSILDAGIIDLCGLSRSEAAELIMERLSATYLNPKVTVVVEEYNNNRIYVVGEVRMPGVYSFGNEPTLLQAVSQAQGLTDKADWGNCSIIRGKDQIITADVFAMLQGRTPYRDIPLLPNDTVYVPPDDLRQVYVLGEVLHPGAYSLGNNLDPIRAVAMAGSATEDGVLSEVRIIRRADDSAVVYKVNLKDLFQGRVHGPMVDLEPLDIVYVPRKGMAGFNYYLRQITPTLSTVIMGATVKELIASD